MLYLGFTKCAGISDMFTGCGEKRLHISELEITCLDNMGISEISKMLISDIRQYGCHTINIYPEKLWFLDGKLQWSNSMQERVTIIFH